MSAALKIVENNLHEIAVNDRHLIFHIPSTSLFSRDKLTGDILDNIRQLNNPTEQELTQVLATNYREADISSAINELQSLQLITNKALPVETFTPVEMDNVPLTTLVLNVNTGCNLSCSYCYKEDLTTPNAGKKMEFLTAKRSIDMLLSESPDQAKYNIVFFGGEPLSNFSLIKDVVNYATQHFAEHGKKVEFSLTTNATLLNDRIIEFLNQHNIGIAISMDGPKAFHDKNRISVTGQGTYETVAQKVELLMAKYKARPIAARVTLTTGVTDIEAIWDHLFNDLGFAEVGFAPVTSGEIDEYNLTDEEMQQVFTNMKKLGDKYLSAALENKSIGFSNLHQLMTDLHEGTKKVLPCGAGVGMVAIDHEGGLNLCHRFTGSDLPLLGNLDTGIDKPKLNEFLNKRLDKSDKGCKTCRIRNLCAGGCYHESYAKYQDPIKPTYHYCDLLRDWIDYGITIYSQIMQHNPTFYNTHIAPRRA